MDTGRFLLHRLEDLANSNIDLHVRDGINIDVGVNMMINVNTGICFVD